MEELLMWDIIDYFSVVTFVVPVDVYFILHGVE